MNFIPIGTYYSFKLVDRQGNKIAFSNSVERPSELGQRLLNSTFEPLYKKAAHLFDSGVELEFGPMRLSRDRGLRIRRLFRNKEIPLNQVSEYRIEQGTFSGGVRNELRGCRIGDSQRLRAFGSSRRHLPSKGLSSETVARFVVLGDSHYPFPAALTFARSSAIFI